MVTSIESYSGFLRAQPAESSQCKLTAEEEALEKASFEVLSKKFQSQIEGSKTPSEIRRLLLTFVTSELKETKLAADQVRLLKWQKQESEKLKLIPILSSELALSKELDETHIVSKSVEIKFVSEAIRDEDIQRLNDSGRLRLMSFDIAKKSKDLAIRKAVERFEKDHPQKAEKVESDYLVIEVPSEMLGRNGATSLKSQKIVVKSSSELVIQEEIHVNEKPDMFFTENIVNRPRKLMFVKIDQGGLLISPMAKVTIDQTKVVDR